MPDSILLSEICISAASKAWKDDGELLATGIGLIPRIAAGLAKLTCNPDLMMTDGETFLISKPLPMGKRDSSQDIIEGYMSYSREKGDEIIGWAVVRRAATDRQTAS